MSVARGNGQNGGHFYSNITQPVKLDVQFTVTPSNGLGVSSVMSNGYARNIFMHTSTTPASNNGYLNPNPANGIIMVQLQNNYKKFLGLNWSVQAPNTGSDLTSVSANVTYVITALGTASLAQWQAKGLPLGITPAVGVAFVATASGTIGGSATVKVPTVSGVSSIETIGDPNAALNAYPLSSYGGAILMLQCLGAGAFTGTALGTHTHDFTVIGGQAAATTNVIAAYAGPLIGKEAATNATFVGADSASNGGVVAASAGTPAGSLAAALAAPATGSIINLSLYFDISSVSIDGL